MSNILTNEVEKQTLILHSKKRMEKLIPAAYTRMLTPTQQLQ